jgi:hypothetical protein
MTAAAVIRPLWVYTPGNKAHNNQLTSYATGLHLLKLEKNYVLLVILLLMHVASALTSDNNNAATRRWAPCSPVDDIADSDAAGTLPTIYSTRAGGGGGEGGGGG